MGQVDFRALMRAIMNEPEWRACLPAFELEPISQEIAERVCASIHRDSLSDDVKEKIENIVRSMATPPTKEDYAAVAMENVRLFVWHSVSGWIEVCSIAFDHRHSSAADVIELDDRGLPPMAGELEDAWNMNIGRHGVTLQDADRIMREFIRRLCEQHADALASGVRIDSHVLRLVDGRLVFSAD